MQQRLLLALLAVSLTAAVGKADLVTIEPGNHPQPGEEANVLFNQPGLMNSGLTVQGATKPGIVFDFTSNESLMTPARGQAMITAADGGGFTDLRIDDRTGVFFSDFIFNVHTLMTPARDAGTGTLFIMVDLLHGGTVTESFKLGSGENFFTLAAASGQEITDVRLSSTVALKDFEQARVSGMGGTTGGGSVPEPSSLLLLGSGLLGLAKGFRRFI